MSLSAKGNALATQLTGGHIILMAYLQASASLVTANFNTSTERIDLGGGFTPAPVVGMIGYFTAISNTTDFAANTHYFVTEVSGNEVGLATTPGGAKINITVQPATATFRDAQPVSTVGGETLKVETVASAVRHEIDDYGTINSGNRPVFTDPSASISYATRASGTQMIDSSGNSIPNLAGAGYDSAATTTAINTTTPVEYEYAVIVTGGSATPGNTSGSLTAFPDCTGDGTTKTAGPDTNIFGPVYLTTRP